MKVQIVLSSFGFWGEELVAPMEEFDAANVEYAFATPYGDPPAVVDVSMDPEYVDPPLGVKPTSLEMAEKVRSLVSSDRLDNVTRVADLDIRTFDAILLVGGSGPILDINNCRPLHALIQECYRSDKLIACECYSVGVLPFTRHPHDPETSIIRGRRVTGHPIRFDYTTPYGYANVTSAYPFIGPPIALEDMLRHAIGPDGQFLGDTDEEISVVLDPPFLTSRSVPESRECGRQVVRHLSALQNA